MIKNWKNKAQEFALDKFDYIIDIYNGIDFIEFVGSIGGDVLTYRYYANGRISER